MAIIPLMLSCELRICTRGAWHMRSISPAPRRCPMPRDSGACRIASRRDRTHVSSTALHGGDLAIHTCICATAPLRPRSMAAPGARSAGGAAMWHAGAASRAVRMSLRGDAWRRGAPCGYRWPVRTARWPQSGARTNGPVARVCGSALCGGSAWPAGFAHAARGKSAGPPAPHGLQLRGNCSP